MVIKSIYVDDLKELYKAGELYRKGEITENVYESFVCETGHQIVSVEETELRETLLFLSGEIEYITLFCEDDKVREEVLKIVQQVEDIIGTFPEEPEDPYAWPFEDYR